MNEPVKEGIAGEEVKEAFVKESLLKIPLNP